MNLDHDSILSKLGHRELRSVEVATVMQFRCLEGSVWITQHGEAEDLIVEQGSCVTLVKKGVVLLQALKSEAVCTLNSRTEEKGASAASPLETVWPCKDRCDDRSALPTRRGASMTWEPSLSIRL